MVHEVSDENGSVYEIIVGLPGLYAYRQFSSIYIPFWEGYGVGGLK